MNNLSRTIATVLALFTTAALADGQQVVTEFQGSPLVIKGTKEIDSERAFMLPAKASTELVVKRQVLDKSMDNYAALVQELGDLIAKLDPEAESSEAAKVLMAIAIVKERLAELESIENEYLQAKSVDNDEEPEVSASTSESDIIAKTAAH